MKNIDAQLRKADAKVRKPMRKLPLCFHKRLFLLCHTFYSNQIISKNWFDTVNGSTKDRYVTLEHFCLKVCLWKKHCKKHKNFSLISTKDIFSHLIIHQFRPMKTI